MDERIEKILKTDADARKRIAIALQKAKEVSQSTVEEIEKMRVQYEKKAENKTNDIKKEQKKSMTLFEEKKRAETEAISQKLDETAKEKTDEWVEEIYCRTISAK